MTIGWIVSYSKVQRENYAAEQLARQSVEYYLPFIVETVLRGRSGQKVEIAKATPLFPRYIFVFVEHQWRHILSTFGIQGVILRGGEPAFMPAKMIERIRAREDQDGIVKLPKIEALRAGETVRIIAGPLQGATGIYEGMGPREREKVLLNYLGRKTSILFPQDQIARLAAA